MKPKVTVLMPVYNGERFLKEAIQSILNQSFKDFEFLIINDGSTDSSVDIINKFDDPRIRLIHNEKNINVEATLNRGLDLAEGEYIARMDADDVALQNRLEKQVSFMDSNPEIGVCGSAIHLFGQVEHDIRNPQTHEEIQCSLLFNNVIAHPSTILRKSFFDKFKLKYETFRYAEDLELWNRSSFLFKLHNLPDILLNYRINNGSVSQTFSVIQNQSVNRIIETNLLRLGLKPTPDIISLHKDIGNKIQIKSLEDLNLAGKHLNNILTNNNNKSIYPKKTSPPIMKEEAIFMQADFQPTGLRPS